MEGTQSFGSDEVNRMSDRNLSYANSRKDMTPEEVVEHYNSRTNYDNETHSEIYHGPKYAAQYVEKYLKDQKTAKILDVGAGSGKIGDELHKLGFTNLYALEPADVLFSNSPFAPLYKSNTAVIMGETTVTEFKDDAFDTIVLSGALSVGLIPCGALLEMIRLVKPGGYIINMMQKSHLSTVDEYKDRLVPLIEEVQTAGKLHIEEMTPLQNYIFGREGIAMVFKVLEEGCRPHTSQVLGAPNQ